VEESGALVLSLLNNKSNNLKIGIIGVGKIGGTLVRQYSKAGHRVKMTNHSGIEKLKSLASETGASGVALADVVSDVDVVVISIPMVEIPKLPKQLFEKVSANIPIIDTGNYYPLRDGRIEDIENGMCESVWVSNQIQRPVIKAYNNILAGSLACSGLRKGDPLRLALPIAGDDKASKDLVATLVNDSGFDPFDSGTLEESWRQQPGSPVYCTDLNLAQLKKSIGKAKRELSPGRRDLGLEYIMKHDPDGWMDWWKDFAEYFRAIYESDLD
jgi:8-hydroxy-5-deazaflavin:NADPH oxidoreductase